MLKLSTLFSLKARICRTTDCVWDTQCGARSLPHLTRMFMRNHGLTTPLTSWLDRLVDPPMVCAVECSTGFVRMTWQQASRSGTLSREKLQRFSCPLLWELHETSTLLWVAHRQFPRTSLSRHAPIGSRWFALDMSGDAITIEPDDITSSCGLRVLVSRGGITLTAASSGIAPTQNCLFGIGCAHLASTP